MNITGRDFTTEDISRILPVSKVNFRHWLYKKFIKSSLVESIGPGTRYVFSYRDVVGIYLFKMLVDQFEYSRESAAEYYRGYLKCLQEKEKKQNNQVGLSANSQQNEKQLFCVISKLSLDKEDSAIAPVDMDILHESKYKGTHMMFSLGERKDGVRITSLDHQKIDIINMTYIENTLKEAMASL